MTWTKAEIAAQHDLVGRSVAEQRRLRAEQVALREAMQQDALRRAQDTAEQRIREQARELVRIRQGGLVRLSTDLEAGYQLRRPMEYY